LEIKNEKQQKTSKISWIVFFASLAVAIPTLIGFLFPALIVSLTTSTPDEMVNPLELSKFFSIFIAANLLVLGIYLMYSSQNLPAKIQRSIKFIFDFEVSQRISLLVILILLSVYIAFSFHELEDPKMWADFVFIELALEGWPYEDIHDLSLWYNLHVKNSLLYLSENIFQNIKAVPFIASILLVFLTYLFTVQITKKRFAGLVAMAIVLQSHTFLRYDTTPTYANFSTLFYLLSLYLINKKWHFSPFTFVLSVFSKTITLLFLPMTFFFTYRANISKKQKIYTAISYVAIIVIGVIVMFVFDITLQEDLRTTGISPKEFLTGIASIGFSLRFDELFLIFLLPLIFGLFMASKKGTKHADAVLFLMMGILLSIPIASFVGMTNQPYRLIPFIVFFAVGVGTLLTTKLANRSDNSP